MAEKIGMRELTRNSNVLAGHDYIDVEDKKTHQYKGLFVSADYAEMVKAFIDKKIKQKKQQKLDEIMQFAGIADGEFGDMSIQELTALKYKKYEKK